MYGIYNGSLSAYRTSPFQPPQWPFFSVRLRPKQVDLFSHWLWVMAPGVGPPVDHRSHEQTTNECEDIPIRVTPRGLGAMTSHMGHHKTIFHMFECRTLQFRTVSFYLWAPFSVPRPWGQQGTPPNERREKKQTPRAALQIEAHLSRASSNCAWR